MRIIKLLLALLHLLVAFLLLPGSPALLAAYPVSVGDSKGCQVTFLEKPRKVISLVPAVTEIIFRLGAGDCLLGLTYHDTLPPEVNQKVIVGGFLTPSLAQMGALDPDLVFLSRCTRRFATILPGGRAG